MSIVPPTLTCIGSNATVNMARAMRVAELMTDFRKLQHYMSSIRISPSAEDCHEEGFQGLRHFVVECYRFLQEGFPRNIPSTVTITTKEGDEELAKTQVRSHSRYTSIKSFEKVWWEVMMMMTMMMMRTCVSKEGRGEEKKKGQTDVFELRCCSCMGLVKR